MPHEISLYEVLGVDPASDPQEIKAAYYAVIKTCHPDVDQSGAAPELALAVIGAYSVLSDPERRKAYNARLGFSLVPHSSPSPSTSAGPAAPVPAEPPVFVREPEITADPPLQAMPAGPIAARYRLWRSNVVRGVVAGAGFVLGFALLLLIVYNFRSRTNPATAEAAAPVAFVAATARSEPAVVPPCLDVGSGLQGDKLYRECVKTRVKLHLRMMRLTSGAEMERDELQDAMAEIRQAVGAAQVKMSSTRGFIEESVATFAEIKNTAKDKQVRRIAENYYYYYDCEALKHCAQ